MLHLLEHQFMLLCVPLPWHLIVSCLVLPTPFVAFYCTVHVGSADQLYQGHNYDVFIA